MQSRIKVAAVGLILALISACCPFVSRAVVGPPGALVHVRWQQAVDARTRQLLESRFRLADGQRQDENTWRYDLVDPSRANIHALVSNPAVADTHYIDRSTFLLDPSAVDTTRRLRFAGGDTFVEIADVFAIILGAFAALMLAIGSGRVATRLSPTLALPPLAGETVRRGMTDVLRLITSLMPRLDRRSLGAFRTTLGLGLVWITWVTAIDPIPLQLQRHYGAPDWSVVHYIAGSPAGCQLLELGMLVAAMLFAIGLWARIAYAGFVGAFFLATLIALEGSGAHDLGLPLVTFIGWLAVPWNAGLGIDDWRRRRSPESDPGDLPSGSYGFAIWWPGLTLGVALLAAAYAKLTTSGLTWILGGAVKYHLVIDAANAPVDWGLWLASRHRAAVLMSFGAIAAEALFIANIFVRGPGMRLLIGVAGAAFFFGLYLLQGIYWEQWLVLFLAFLPWPWLNRSSPDRAVPRVAASPQRIGAAPAIAIALLVCTQVYASVAAIQIEPLISNFPMYSNTFASPEDFDRSMRVPLTRIVNARADGQDVTATIGRLQDRELQVLIDVADRTRNAQPPDDSTILCGRYQGAMGMLPAEIDLTLERRGFDWDRGRFHLESVETVPVPLSVLCGKAVATRLAR